MTAIAAVILSFIKKPTADAAKMFEAVFEKPMTAKSLREIGLVNIIKKANELTEQQTNIMFGNARAIRAIAPMLKNLTGLEEDLALMKDRRGRTEEALAKQMATDAFKFKQMKQELLDLARSIGQALIPAFKELMEGIRVVIGAAEDSTEKIAKAVAFFAKWSAIILIVSTALRGIIGVVRGLTYALGGLIGMAKKLGWVMTSGIVAVLAAAAAAVIAFHSEAIRLKEMADSFGDVTASVRELERELKQARENKDVQGQIAVLRQLAKKYDELAKKESKLAEESGFNLFDWSTWGSERAAYSGQAGTRAGMREANAREAREQIKRLEKLSKDAGKNKAADAAKEAAKAAVDGLKNLTLEAINADKAMKNHIKSLQQEVKLIGLAADEAELLEAAFKGASRSQIEAIAALQKQRRDKGVVVAFREEMKRIMEEGRQAVVQASGSQAMKDAVMINRWKEIGFSDQQIQKLMQVAVKWREELEKTELMKTAGADAASAIARADALMSKRREILDRMGPKGGTFGDPASMFRRIQSGIFGQDIQKKQLKELQRIDAQLGEMNNNLAGGVVARAGA